MVNAFTVSKAREIFTRFAESERTDLIANPESSKRMLHGWKTTQKFQRHVYTDDRC